MAAEINDWSTLDELLGIDVEAPGVDDGVGELAFYGRCSTEDNQDPETSHGWQLGNARKFVEPLGGTVTAEFFDIGHSRSVPWERRPDGARLLAALKDPRRTWNAVVVGEGTRCWFGNQFSLIAPRFAAYGVDLWVPELGGKFDPRNPSHKMLMSVLGGMSESERQHVQARVRAAMDAQVLNEGRHQGGRAPYGYRVVDGGEHPNPRKAAEGFRLRVLDVDPETAPIVRRIFAEFLDEMGDRAIAAGLNRDGIPCPSAYRPKQNRHRIADGWQGSTVRAILDNPRYTGFAVFGRWARHETLLNPDDVAAGHVIRFKRSAPDRVVRSRTQAHPALVSVDEFTRATLSRKSRAAGGMRGIARRDRQTSTATHPYLFRGQVRCEVCGRKMQAGMGGRGQKFVYYRCVARRLAPGSPVLDLHPKTVNLRESVLVPAVNGFVGRLFAPGNRDATVRALVASQEGAVESRSVEAARHRLENAETRLRRFRAAIADGVPGVEVAEDMKKAAADRDAAEAELQHVPSVLRVDPAEVYAMIDSLGDIPAALTRARSERMAKLYADLRLTVRYQPTPDGGKAAVSVGVANECVRGGT